MNGNGGDPALKHDGPFFVRQCLVCGFVEAFPEWLVKAWGGVLELPRWDCPNVDRHEDLEAAA